MSVPSSSCLLAALQYSNSRRHPVMPPCTLAGVVPATRIVCHLLQGIDPNIRADVWPFLLEVFDHASTYAQRQHQHYLMTSQYQQLLLQCQVCAAAGMSVARRNHSYLLAPHVITAHATQLAPVAGSSCSCLQSHHESVSRCACRTVSSIL